MPKKSIALFREPNLCSSVGNRVDPYTKRPQQMVLLSSVMPQATRPSSPLQLLRSPLEEVLSPWNAQPMPNLRHRSHWPNRTPTQFVTALETMPPLRSQRDSEMLMIKDSRLPDVARKQIDDESLSLLPRKKQFKVYHKVPRYNTHVVPIRKSPRQLAIDLAVDIITEFELLMIQMGVGPICVPDDKRMQKKSSSNARQHKKGSPILDEDSSDFETDYESDGTSQRHTLTSIDSVQQGAHRITSRFEGHQRSHLSYTTILSGEVELEMEDSFDDEYNYRDDSTSDEEDSSDSSENDYDDDDSTARNKLTTWFTVFSPCKAQEKSFIAQRSKAYAWESGVITGSKANLKDRRCVKDESRLFVVQDSCASRAHFTQDNRDSSSSANDCASGISLEDDNSSVLVPMDHVLTRFSLCQPENIDEPSMRRLYCLGSVHNDTEPEHRCLPQRNGKHKCKLDPILRLQTKKDVDKSTDGYRPKYGIPNKRNLQSKDHFVASGEPGQRQVTFSPSVASKEANPNLVALGRTRNQ